MPSKGANASFQPLRLYGLLDTLIKDTQKSCIEEVVLHGYITYINCP